MFWLGPRPAPPGSEGPAGLSPQGPVKVEALEWCGSNPVVCSSALGGADNGHRVSAFGSWRSWRGRPRRVCVGPGVQSTMGQGVKMKLPPPLIALHGVMVLKLTDFLGLSLDGPRVWGALSPVWGRVPHASGQDEA